MWSGEFTWKPAVATQYQVHGCSEGSSSYFLRRKNLDSLDCVCLQLDHNASRACDHNALRHLNSLWHVLRESFCAQKKPLIHIFIVYGNGVLGKLTKNFRCKSAAITICWYTRYMYRVCHSLSNVQLKNASFVFLTCRSSSPAKYYTTHENVQPYETLNVQKVLLVLPAPKKFNAHSRGKQN